MFNSVGIPYKANELVASRCNKQRWHKMKKIAKQPPLRLWCRLSVAPDCTSQLLGTWLDWYQAPGTNRHSLWLCLFMSAMDTTIVATALIKISGSFNALDQAAWLVTAYLLTYNSFLMLTAKLSDIFGLRSVLLTFTVVFFVFSMACAGAKSMNQLYIIPT